MTVLINGTNGLIQAYDYQVPTTGFSYTFAAGTQTLVMNPAGTLATGTITMPAAPSDGMTITFSTTKQITALTLNGGGGQTIIGGINSMAPNQAVSFMYRLANTTWFPMTTQVAQGTGPAFSVYSNANQSISANTWTKILFQVEEFDTNNNFASSTFTPTVAGYYQINSVIYHAGAGGSILAVYKNGAAFKWGIQGQAGSYTMSSAQALVYCNGTTDYIDIYYFESAGTATVSSNSLYTFAQGAMVRAA
jgi:hypothetical protein